MSARPLPVPDIEAEPQKEFWAGAKAHKLMIQKCNNCGDVRYPPLPVCPKCWSEDQTWVEASGNGTLWSFVIYRRTMDPAFEAPYAVGRVKTEEGPNFTVLLDVPLDELEIGMPLKVSFEDRTDTVTIPHFTKA